MGDVCAACHDRREEGTQPPQPLAHAFFRTESDQGAIAFSHDGRKVITLDFGGSLAFHDVHTGESREDESIDMGVTLGSVPFACNGRRVLVRGYSASALFDAVTGKLKSDDGIGSHGDV